MSITLLFWFLVFLTIYPYLVYPFLLVSISRNYPLKVPQNDTGKRPDVAVLISAFNEEKHIVARINNLLDQQYPAQHLKIYIGTDGCTDNTVALVRGIQDPRLVLFEYAENRGKISVLNDMLARVKEPIVAFSDANTFYHADAIEKLVRHFADAEVGGVCGELHLVDKKTGSNQDGLYWKFEQFLKYHEAKIGAYLGANGAIYALRRNLYEPLPSDTITDDFMIFMNLAVAGFQLRYATEAIAEEEVAPDVGGEYGRRVRIGTGNFQAFFRLFKVFQAQQKWRIFSYISHKVIRWFTPHMMLLLLLLNGLLLDQLLYQIIFALQGLLYVSAYFMMNISETMKLPAAVRLMIFFVSMNLALGHGFLRFISGNYQGAWQRTER